MTLEECKEEIRGRRDKYIKRWFKDNNVKTREPGWTSIHVAAARDFVMDELARLGLFQIEDGERLHDIKKRLEKVEAQVKQLERRKG